MLMASTCYYGAASTPPHKWVNLAELCVQVLPGLNIHRIRYFTALVKPLPSDPHTKAVRQEIYIRALETLSNLTVHYGHYLQSTVSMPLPLHVLAALASFRTCSRWKNKGSDVNIATYMLIDAFRKD